MNRYLRLVSFRPVCGSVLHIWCLAVVVRLFTVVISGFVFVALVRWSVLDVRGLTVVSWRLVFNVFIRWNVLDVGCLTVVDWGSFVVV